MSEPAPQSRDTRQPFPDNDRRRLESVGSADTTSPDATIKATGEAHLARVIEAALDTPFGGLSDIQLAERALADPNSTRVERVMAARLLKARRKLGPTSPV